MTAPLSGDPLDCVHAVFVQPTFSWDMGEHDTFKVFMGSSPGFEKGTRVTSGKKKITTGSWTPSRKKWKNACTKALKQATDPNNPVMFVAVEGQDRDRRKGDPQRKLLSFAVQATVQ